MTQQKFHYSSIEEFTTALGLPAPQHPMLCVCYKGKFDSSQSHNCSSGTITYSTDFYTIAIKNILAGEMHYGRTRYDFSHGSMMFTAPRQEITLSNVAVSSDAVMIFFHEDFIRGHAIGNSIKKYGFFSYAVNEALHLSEKEETYMRALMGNIHAEYVNNQDEFSKELLLSQLDTLLKYANRFYKRQFLNRADISIEIVDRFEKTLQTYFEEGKFKLLGTPKVDEIASEMNMSARYLSDMLKVETGKSALENIHLYLLDEAKNLLLQPDITVAEVAYQLGFEYPQYFSRLFKKKIGISPKGYRDLKSMH